MEASMKWTLASLVVLAVAAGCANSNKKDNQTASLTPAVTDITPTPAPVAPQQPVMTEQAAAPAAAQQATGGTRYTVKKGDTLWKIATAQYGNGNQWQKICSANPGLTAETLKAGQTIVLP
jgi:5'-nucleotidase/UDP-sugar diphosphatase